MFIVDGHGPAVGFKKINNVRNLKTKWCDKLHFEIDKRRYSIG